MPVTNEASGIKAGTVAHFAASTAPAGWMKCNGATLSRATYAALWNAVNPANGGAGGVGDGATTFTIPDLRGEFVRGLDDGRGVDTGRAIGSAQAGQMQSHTHSMTANSVSGSVNPQFAVTGGASGGGTATTTAQGGTTNGSENRPRNVAMLACIKF